MPTICTLGHPSIRTEFTYTGSVVGGVTLAYTGQPFVSKYFFGMIIKTFQDQTVPGGFNMANPPAGGFGEWVQNNSTQYNTEKLSPRHASHIAAILENEGYLTSILVGKAVILSFNHIP